MTSNARGRRGSGVRIFGIIGLLLSLLLAIGVLLGRGWVANQVDGAFDSIDQAVGRGTTIVAQTNGRLQERVADLDAVLADLSGSLAGATVPAAVADRAASIADRFSEIRDGWVAARARIDAALETLAQVDAALPFVDLPPGPTEELAALDQRFLEIEDNVSRLRGRIATTVQDVTDVVTAIRGAVSRVAEAGTNVEARLAAVQDRIDVARGNVESVMWITTIALLLFVAYIALLNYLLVRGYGRGDRTVEVVTTPPVEDAT